MSISGSKSYDKDLEDIFAIQSEIAQRVASALEIKLLSKQDKETDNIVAYSEFLRAREILHESAEIKIREALSLFESATQKDPKFARAHVGIATCYRLLGDNGHIPLLQAIQHARTSLEVALAANNQLAEAFAELAQVEGMQDNMRGIATAARRAIELNPNLADALSSLAGYKLVTGDMEGSIRLRERAYQLDPLILGT